MNQTDKVSFEVKDSIGIISLNDPPGNLLEIPEFVPISIFRKWISAEIIKGLIITGMGKNFSAGGKLGAIFDSSGNSGNLKLMMQDGLTLLNYIENLDIPVIAAINRVCFGGGLEIALACHIRVASENALLAFPEVNQNLMPGMGGTTRLPLLSGLSQSIKIILGGDIVNARDAKDLGMIDHIAPKDMAFEYSWSLMHKMTHDRPLNVINSIMKAMKNASVLSHDEAMQEETRMFCSLAKEEAERRKTEKGKP